MQRPYSQACENNKGPILDVIGEVFAGVDAVLEIGSGTGQHAAWFAAHLPKLRWQPSDLAENLPGIEQWRADSGAGNLRPAIELDVRWRDWGVRLPAGLFTANTLHIMPWQSVEALFEYVGLHAPAGCRCCVYGPLNYQGGYTSESNEQFDQWLRQRDPASGIRDFEALDELAAAAGFLLQEDHAMPANNRLLYWRKAAG